MIMVDNISVSQLTDESTNHSHSISNDHNLNEVLKKPIYQRINININDTIMSAEVPQHLNACAII